MNPIPPHVRHMLLCDDVRPSPTNRRKINVYGLVSEIHSTGGSESFPVQFTFSVYLALTEGRGQGTAQIAIVAANTGEIAYLGAPHPIEFDADPLKVLGVIIHITACSFPAAGLYWVEFRYEGTTIAREPLQVR